MKLFESIIFVTICALLTQGCMLSVIVKDNSLTSSQHVNAELSYETAEQTVIQPTTPLPPRQIKKKRPRKRYKKPRTKHRYKHPPTKRNSPPVKRSRPKKRKTINKKPKRTKNVLPKDKEKR